MSASLFRLLGWIVVGSVVLVTGWLLLNTTFMLYDDEGYVLQSYRAFAQGERLYDEVYTQYGPAPYLYHLLISKVCDVVPTHNFGRSITWMHWTFCSLFAGMLTARLTRATLAAFSACLATFGLLMQMSSEPSHPGGLIAFVLAGTLMTATLAHNAARWRTFTVILGATTALLSLTKINVGLLFGAGVVVWALRHTRLPSGLARIASPASWLLLLSIPWVLMAGRLDHPRVLAFAIHFTICAAAILWLNSSRQDRRIMPARAWLPGLATFGAVATVVLGATLARGTSPAAMYEALFVAPLRHSANFLIATAWPMWTWPLAAASTLVAVWVGRAFRAENSDSKRLIPLHLARLAGVAVLCAGSWLAQGYPRTFLTAILPILPLYCVTTEYKEECRRDLLALLGFVAVPQVLHAFPVAGSQIAWGCFLFVSLLVNGFHESWMFFARSLGASMKWALAGPAFLLGVAAFQMVGMLAVGKRYREESLPLGLPGAETIFLDGETRLALRTLSLNAMIHADVLFSRPGAFSFNLWTGVPTPTSHNATQWSWQLSEPEQLAIVARMKADPKSAWIGNPMIEKFMREQNVPTGGALWTHLDTDYRLLLAAGPFTFNVPKNSLAAPFGRVRTLAASNRQADLPPYLFRANIALEGRPVLVRLKQVNYPWSVLETYDGHTSEVSLAPINTQGEPIGAALLLGKQTQQLQGLYRLDVFMHTLPNQLNQIRCMLEVLDGKEVVLAQAGF